MPVYDLTPGIEYALGAMRFFLFLREPFTARKGAGLAAALAALASLAFG
jgi:hypothetical protein